MPANELFALSNSGLRQRKSDGFHPNKPSQRPSAQYESNSKSDIGAENLSTKEGGRDKPLPLIPDSTWPLRPFYSQEDIRDFSSPWSSGISADDTHGAFRDEVELQDLRQQCLTCTEAPLESDGSGNDSDRWSLLKTPRGDKKKGRHMSSRYSETLMRTYYRRARAVIQPRSRRIVGSSLLFSSFRMTRGIRNIFSGYDRAHQVSAPRYIGEHDFWILLKRFFGLVPLPPSLLELFPANDEIPYIKDYLRSKPTPAEHSDWRDDDRNLVKVCTRLTEWVFRHNESKSIFFAVDPETYSQSTNTDWEIFQGFGLIHRFCGQLGYGQLDLSKFEVQRAWLQVNSVFCEQFQTKHRY